MTTVAFCAAVAAWGQTAVAATGGSARGGGYALSYSVGQVAAAATPDGRLREGVVQPLIVEEVGIARQSDAPCTLSVFPNPAVSGLTLSREGAGEVPSEVRLYSLDGRLMASTTWSGPSLTLDLGAFAAGMYMLQIDDKTFKITKL